MPADRLRAERPNQVWALDFMFDTTSDGRPFKVLSMCDEFTKECPPHFELGLGLHRGTPGEPSGQGLRIESSIPRKAAKAQTPLADQTLEVLGLFRCQTADNHRAHAYIVTIEPLIES